MGTTLILVSGIVCLVAAAFMFHTLWIDYKDKTHSLRMFQLGYGAALFLVSGLQVFKWRITILMRPEPFYYPATYNVIWLLMGSLAFLYHNYYITKKQQA